LQEKKVTLEPKKRSRGRPRSQISDAPTNTVQALDRGLLLLGALSRAGGATLTDLAMRVGMPPSSAHRILATLASHGFVDFDEATQEWAIGIEAFRIGNSYLAGINIIEAAQKPMKNLMEATGETANLAISDRGDVVFLSQIESKNPIRAFFAPGTRGHIHASGIGKALLAALPLKELEGVLLKKGLPEFTDKSLTSPAMLYADLDRIRACGWAFDDEERYSGMRCVAAAIYNGFGEAIAGVSVSGPTVRFPDDIVSETGPKVKRAADEITMIIGGKIPGNLDK